MLRGFVEAKTFLSTLLLPLKKNYFKRELILIQRLFMLIGDNVTSKS